MGLDEIVARLEHAETGDVLSVLLDLDESERRVLGPRARSWLTRGNPTCVAEDHAALAVLATAGGVRQAMVAVSAFWLDRSDFVDHAVVLLQERAPSWLPELVETMLEGEALLSWQLARGLVRCGAVAPPDHPQYFRGTVLGLPDYVTRARRPLLEQLEKDPGLIGEHLVRMLATEGTGRLLSHHDSYQERTHDFLQEHTPFPEGTWRVALLTLAEQGRVDRGRLLDTVLAAPLCDWAAADLGWFVGMHDALEPGLDEVVARQATYARLLSVEHGPSVKLAQRELTRLLGDPRLQPELLLDASPATLGRSDKSTVTAQLRLLEKLAAAHPELAAADAVRIALDHPRADVRERATKLLDKLGEHAEADEPAREFVPPAPEPRPEPSLVEPVRDADELAEVLLALMEEVDPLELERAIDGLLRFADQRPSTAEVLLTRAGEATPYLDDPRLAPVVLTLAWLTPRRPRDGEWRIVLGMSFFPELAAPAGTFVGSLGSRLTDIARTVRRGPRASVALPQYTDGSLDAAVLSARLADLPRGMEPSDIELGAALLRVPREQRAEVVVPSAILTGAPRAAPPTPRPRVWEREVVAFSRTYEEQWRVPVFWVAAAGDAAPDGDHSVPEPWRTVREELAYGEHEPRFEQTLGFGALMVPHDLDVLAALTHVYFCRDLRKDRAACVPVLHVIAGARVPNGSPESSALVLGLAAKDARGRTAAQDALIDLARHGLLDGKELGRQAAALLEDGVVVGQRVSGGLVDVARAADAAVVPVLEALQELVGALVGRRDAGAFLELAADLVERTGRAVVLPGELRRAAEGTSSSRVAKAARRLVRTTGDGAATR